MSLCIVFCINGFAASPLEPRSRHNLKASLSLGTSLIALIAMVPPSLAFIQTYLQEAWPTVESALAEYGIICKLDLVFRYITIKTTRTTDPDIIVKAKQLVELLPIRIPAIRVVKLSDMHCDIIQLGEINGLGSKFAVTPLYVCTVTWRSSVRSRAVGQYSVRLGRLMHYLHVGA
ncbi:unnamed protein product [Prunus armeniaca]